MNYYEIDMFLIKNDVTAEITSCMGLRALAKSDSVIHVMTHYKRTSIK